MKTIECCMNKINLIVLLACSAGILIIRKSTAQEMIDCAALSRGLSDRGVVFQVPAGSGSNGRFASAIGAGDVDGDQFSDLLFSAEDSCSGLYEAMLVFGKPDSARVINLNCELPGIAIFKPRISQKTTSMDREKLSLSTGRRTLPECILWKMWGKT